MLTKLLSSTIGWRGYIVWACAFLLFVMGTIDETTFGAITAGALVGKGIEGNGRFRGPAK